MWSAMVIVLALVSALWDGAYDGLKVADGFWCSREFLVNIAVYSHSLDQLLDPVGPNPD